MFVAATKGATILLFLNSDMSPSITSRMCGKFYFSSKFLKTLSHPAFVDGTFTKADAIRSIKALQ